MRKLLYGSGAGVAAAALLFAGVPAGAAPEPAGLAPLTLHPEEQAANPAANSFIVNLKDGASGADTARELGVDAKHVYESALNGFSANL